MAPAIRGAIAAAASASAAAAEGAAGREVTSGARSDAWAHTKILLGKNLKLKRQQYLVPPAQPSPRPARVHGLCIQYVVRMRMRCAAHTAHAPAPRGD